MIDKAIFAKAADIIEERGWHQGTYQGADGEVCFLGAINVAATGNAYAWPTEVDTDAFHKWVGQQWARKTKKKWNGKGNIGGWNDAKRRTKAQVINFLRELAQ